MKGVTLSAPWNTLIPGHLEGAGQVVAVYVESKWWVVRILQNRGRNRYREGDFLPVKSEVQGACVVVEHAVTLEKCF